MSTTACDDQLIYNSDYEGLVIESSLSKQREQIADLILGYSEGMEICSPLEKDMNYGPNTTYKFEISDGKERLCVSITISPVKLLRAV